MSNLHFEHFLVSVWWKIYIFNGFCSRSNEQLTFWKLFAHGLMKNSQSHAFCFRSNKQCLFERFLISAKWTFTFWMPFVLGLMTNLHSEPFAFGLRRNWHFERVSLSVWWNIFIFYGFASPACQQHFRNPCGLLQNPGETKAKPIQDPNRNAPNHSKYLTKP
jgi:hypothetical protein